MVFHEANTVTSGKLMYIHKVMKWWGGAGYFYGEILAILALDFYALGLFHIICELFICMGLNC